MKKYKLTEESIKVDGTTVYRIKALRSFSNVKKGDKGGFVETEDNLSHFGDAWVYYNAMVFGNAKVYEYAHMSGNAKVYGDARVYGRALVFGNAQVYGAAWVFGDAQVFGDAKVFGNACVTKGVVSGSTTVSI